METVFNAYEALRIGLEMEKDGFQFYSSLASRVSDAEARALLQGLAEDELQHMRKFEEMIDSENFGNAWAADDLQMLNEFIEETVQHDIFPDKKEAQHIALGIDDLRDVLTMAAEHEDKAVDYYRELATRCTFETGKKAFFQLMEEEKAHAANLKQALENL